MKESKSSALIPTNATSMVSEATSEVKSLAKSIEIALDIKSDLEYQNAADVLRQIQTVKKSVDNHRKSVAKPLDAAKKAVQAMFQPMLKQLQEAREDIENSMGGWEHLRELEAEKAREAERRKAEAQSKRLGTIANKKIALAETREEACDIRDDMKASQEAALSVGAAKESLVDGEAPKVAGVSSSDFFDFEVLDLSIVPPAYVRCEIKRVEVVSYVRQCIKDGVEPEISGIRFFKTKSRSVRSF